jgi:hypothetical protein
VTHFINIRGTNGSGKTTLVSHFVTSPAFELLRYQDKAGDKWFPGHVHYDKDTGIAVIGKYQGRECGGTDKIKTQDAVQLIIDTMVQMYQPRFVLFEGLLVSGLFQRYLDYDLNLTACGHRYTWVFLSPSVDECMVRVKARSQRSYDTEEAHARLYKNVFNKDRAVQSVKQKAIAAGREVYVLGNNPIRDCVEELRNLMAGTLALREAAE